jgi:hypothetical protein
MKKKPMKTKRYADEGLVEEDFKKKGLDSSKDERVGFFERLRMGNIDSPNSEAYKRFGAGRGRMDAERAANAAAPNQDISRLGKSEVSSPFLMGRIPVGGPREAPSMSSESSDDMQRRANMGEPATTAIQSAVGKPPASTEVVKSTVRKVIKEKGKKPSGYQIDEEGPAKIGNQNTFNMDKAFKGAGKKEGSLAPLAMGSLAALLGGAALSKRAKQGGTKPVDDRPSSGGKNPRLMGIDPMMEGDLERMAGEGGPNFKKGGKTKARAKPMQKFASGGSVSSASKRGDGIAQKGKTRGRMV